MFSPTFSYFCSFVILSVISDSTQHVSPKLDEFRSKRFQKLGTKFSLLCSPQEGSKPFRFEWRKDNILLKSIQVKYKIDTEDDDSQFNIFTLDIEDTGNYSCTVKNEHGSDSQYTFLIVQGLTFFPKLIWF